ncbi:hypothetical protein ACEQPO_04880 [Bacillus sp. SL00103]
MGISAAYKETRKFADCFCTREWCPYQKIEAEVPFAVTLFDLTNGSTQDLRRAKTSD